MFIKVKNGEVVNRPTNKFIASSVADLESIPKADKLFGSVALVLDPISSFIFGGDEMGWISLSSDESSLVGDMQSLIDNHNVSALAHQDIRSTVSSLDSRLTALLDTDDTTLDQLSEIVAYIKDNRELIEQITTAKVNVSDIVDNLETSVATKVLSANQGVILRQLTESKVDTAQLNSAVEAALATAKESGDFDGADGITPQISIGTVSTGEEGTNAAATITGDVNDLKLNLTIPRGNTGAQGATGQTPTISIGTVSSLGEGESATAEITGTSPNLTLNLGIPVGATGAQGETGSTGATGATPQFSIGTVSTLEPTEQASVTLDGTAAEPTLNFGIPKGADGDPSELIDDTVIAEDSAWSSEKVYNSVLAPVEFSGNPVTFESRKEGAPIHIVVSWEPKQEGEGDPSPDNVRPISGLDSVQVTRRGVNLYNADALVAIYGDADTYGYGVPADDLVIGETYTISVNTPVFSFKIRDYKSGYNSANADAVTDGKRTFVMARNSNIPSHSQQYILVALGADLTNLVSSPEQAKSLQISICAGEDAMPYEPYTGTAATLSLPSTVYGGEVDVETGEGSDEWEFVEFDGSEDELWVKVVHSSGRVYFQIDITPHGLILDPTQATWKCNRLVSYVYNYSDIEFPEYSIGFMSTRNTCAIVLENESMLSVDEFKAWLAENPVTVCYKLATPQPIQATGAQPLSTLSGNNTIATNADTLTAAEMVYPTDTSLSIEGMPADAAATKQALNKKVNSVQVTAEYSSGEKIASISVDNQFTDIYMPVQSEDEKMIEFFTNYYAMRRTGKVYQTRLYKFNSNPTTEGEKLLDNAGLVFEPSTDTTEGQDDYLNGQNPLFEWVYVNYKRYPDGTAYPIAIEGTPEFKTEGAVDVGAMQMEFYWNVIDEADSILITISDSPNEELGLVPWYEGVRADGTVLPWCIGSAYPSSLGEDGKLYSQPNKPLANFQSFNTMMAAYPTKGEGYHGAGIERSTFQIIFNAIKGATKSSQTLFKGHTAYSYQYPASIERAENDNYFPVTNEQAANLVVGSGVYIGYASAYTSGTDLNIDRGQTTMHAYTSTISRITSIEPLDDGTNTAVYVDCNPFPTAQVTTGEVISPVYLSIMPSFTGTTNKVIGRHDGSYLSNTNGKMPYRVQGREYLLGAYEIASNVIMEFEEDKTTSVYVAPKGATITNDITTIRSNWTKIGTIPTIADNGDFWIGDIGINTSVASWYPSVVGSSESQGIGDRCYRGGATAAGIREFLSSGYLGYGSAAGSCSLDCGGAPSGAHWGFVGAD